jgi:DNA-directed RNA polymerase alpha subunit
MVMESKNQTDIPKISGPFNDALGAAGITSLEQLCEWTEKELLKLHGVGAKGIRMLKEVMAEKGMSLKA